MPDGQEEQSQCLWQQFVAQELQALEDVARVEKKQSASRLSFSLPCCVRDEGPRGPNALHTPW